MANTQINIGANGTTTLATAGKYCDKNIDVNVAVPASGVTPTGTKTITSNGEHDVSTFEKAQVNVPIPSGYIKPSGSINIDQNGTIDVSQYASAVVSVPTPAQKIAARTITISSDTAGANALVTLLSNDDFIKEHYADEGFFVTMFLVTPVASVANALHFIYQGNKNIGSSNVSRTGGILKSTSASAAGWLNCTTNINGKGYSNQLRAASDGSLKQYLATNNTLKAGQYMIVLGCFT